MKRILILGAGITGLTLRWRLSNLYPDAEVVLLEKKERLGGLMQTSHEPFFFEKGPRMFHATRSAALLQLIREVGLEGDIVCTPVKSSMRYLLQKGKLLPVPKKLWQVPFSPLTRPVIWPLLTEVFRKPIRGVDESIDAFAMRRFGKYVSEVFFDSMTQGIYAGDPKKLSIYSTFPSIKRLEDEYGSVIKGMFKKKKKQLDLPPGMKRSSLFALKGGMSQLVNTLQDKGRGEIITGFAASDLSITDEKVSVSDGKKTYEGDYLFCALPFHEMGKFDAYFDNFFEELPSIPLITVNIAYKKNLLNKQGYGYLIPTREKHEVLGVVFDSNIFPDYNQYPEETRFTVMLGGMRAPHFADYEEGKCVEIALKALRDHLGITDTPDYTHVSIYKKALPACFVGHQERARKLERMLQEKYPRFFLYGNYLHGNSVNQCIEGALNAILPR